MTKYKLQYEKDDKVEEIEVRTRILTPRLRVKLMSFDKEWQLILKKRTVIQKELEKIDEKYAKQMDDYTDTLPKDMMSEEYLQSALAMHKISLMTEEEIVCIQEFNEELSRGNDERTIKLFKIMVDMAALKDDEKELLGTEPGSEFWQSVDISQAGEITESFRKTEKC